MLRHVGARDVSVNSFEATFSTLIPIPPSTPIPAGLEVVPVRWDRVSIGVADPLPEFTIRILSLVTSRSVPNQAARTDHQLTVEVLRPVSNGAP